MNQHRAQETNLEQTRIPQEQDDHQTLREEDDQGHITTTMTRIQSHDHRNTATSGKVREEKGRHEGEQMWGLGFQNFKLGRVIVTVQKASQGGFVVVQRVIVTATLRHDGPCSRDVRGTIYGVSLVVRDGDMHLVSSRTFRLQWWHHRSAAECSLYGQFIQKL